MKLQPQTLDADWQGWRDSWQKSPEYLGFWVQCLKHYLFPQSHDNWLDLGCGDGKLSGIIKDEVGLSLTLVDPFPNETGIIAASSHTFLSKATPLTYDKILFKQSLHFEKDRWGQVFDLTYDSMKPGGRCLIVALPGYTTIPLFQAAKSEIEESPPFWTEYERQFKRLGLTTCFSLERFTVRIKKKQLLALVARRFLSDLRRVSQETLDNGIAEMDRALPEIVDFDDSVMCGVGIKISDNLNPTYIGKSTIHGLGLFAGENIAKGAVLGEIDGGVAHFSTLPTDKYTEWLGIGGDMVFLAKHRTKLSMVNHSAYPNVEFQLGKIFAKTAIAQGAEITVDYRIGLPKTYQGDYLS